MSWLDRLMFRSDDERQMKDREVLDLTVKSADTLRRVERLVRLARIDAEMAAAAARHRQAR